jgi:hypothetical protein
MLNQTPLPWVMIGIFTRHLVVVSIIFLLIAPACGALATDKITSTDRSSASNSITSTFSTKFGNELLLAFNATDANSSGITVTGVSGANWVFVRRTNAQLLSELALMLGIGVAFRPTRNRILQRCAGLFRSQPGLTS